VFVTVPIQLLHERHQVLRHRGASGVSELGPQSGRKRLQELHRVEGDGGQTTHPNTPTDLPWPNVRSRALCCESDRGGFVPTRREDFCGQWSWTALRLAGQEHGRAIPLAEKAVPFPSDGPSILFH
jgi:hypothetical protein